MTTCLLTGACDSAETEADLDLYAAFSGSESDWSQSPQRGMCSPKFDLSSTIYPGTIDPAIYWPHGTIKRFSTTGRVRVTYNKGTEYPCRWVDTEEEGFVLIVDTEWQGQNNASCCVEPIDGHVYSGFRGTLHMRDAQSIAQFTHAADFRAEYAAVLRLYWAFFLREPDLGGARYWVLERYMRGTNTSEIAEAFAVSGEFEQSYGPLDDAAFLRLVYRNVLGREPDAGGLAFWSEQMSAGMSRGAVMESFASSPEFVDAHPYPAN